VLGVNQGMDANTPLPRPFAKNPLQKDSLYEAITAALLQFDEPILLIREQPSQCERVEITF
jgi:hypothetical protein